MEEDDKNLGRLEAVDLRRIWAKEDGNFTPWLASEEGLALLADTIGMEDGLELKAQEKYVGPFRADILARDVGNPDEDRSWVLIENQLERTDHLHLGQLLTYAAGLDTATIVWVASNFRDEHRAALDWLNEITGERFHFFGLEIELWKIGTSKPAPKLKLVAHPNDWRKQVKRMTEEREMTEAEKFRLEYWTRFAQDSKEKSSADIRWKSPSRDSYHLFAIGKSVAGLAAWMQTQKKAISVELWFNDREKAYFNLLLKEKDAIEREIKKGVPGAEPVWREMRDKKMSNIQITQEADPNDRADWPNQHAWLLNGIETFNRVFRERIRNIDPAEWDGGEDAEADE